MRRSFKITRIGHKEFPKLFSETLAKSCFYEATVLPFGKNLDAVCKDTAVVRGRSIRARDRRLAMEKSRFLDVSR